jgi:Family of unknown function (DUF5681)
MASRHSNDRDAGPKRGQGTGTSKRSATTGYGRPPEHARFKPGSSGNPKGRRKNSRNLKTIIQQALTSSVTLREGSRTRTVSKLEGIVLRQVESALKGNEKAALAVLRMASHVDLLSGSDNSSENNELTAAEKRILDEFITNTAKASSRGRPNPSKKRD